MAFTDLQSFLDLLEKEGELKRVTEVVNPELEVTEIATRAVKENLPALLFENIKGCLQIFFQLILDMLK